MLTWLRPLAFAPAGTRQEFNNILIWPWELLLDENYNQAWKQPSDDSESITN